MALSMTIASVPIALPMVMKVTLAVGAKEMAKEGGIVTHLTALEEIASMVVLCSDKTGTLTTAQMTVYHETAACFNGFSGKEARASPPPATPLSSLLEVTSSGLTHSCGLTGLARLACGTVLDLFYRHRLQLARPPAWPNGPSS